MNPATDFQNRAKPWIAVDLDRTLAHYEHWVAADEIGEPVPQIVHLVKQWLKNGREVRIFTARVWHDNTPEMFERSELARTAIQRWCVKHIGQELPITCIKDLGCELILDDLAVSAGVNTGYTSFCYFNDKVNAIMSEGYKHYQEETVEQ